MSAVADAAMALVGTRYRLHGRDAVHGVDCVGLVALACGIAAPTGYGLRGSDPARVMAVLDGVLERREVAAVGSVLLCVPGAGQLHLAVRVAGGIVHADAGVRRVVMRPGAVPWPVLGCWQTGGADGDADIDGGGDGDRRAGGRGDRRADRTGDRPAGAGAEAARGADG